MEAEQPQGLVGVIVSQKLPTVPKMADMEQSRLSAAHCHQSSTEKIPEAGELLSMLGERAKNVTPYPLLAVTRNTERSLQITKDMISRFLKSNSHETFNPNTHDDGYVNEEVTPLNTGANTHMLKSQSLPAWPSMVTGDGIKFGLKRSLSKKRFERIQLPLKAQPKVSTGFWGSKGNYLTQKSSSQERLPSRARSHSELTRNTPMKKPNPVNVPPRPHTVIEQANQHAANKNHTHSIDPDLINPRLLVDVLESENVNVTAKDLFNLSDWAEYNGFKNMMNEHRDYINMPRNNSYFLSKPKPHDMRQLIDRLPSDTFKNTSFRRMCRPKHGEQRLKEGGFQKVEPVRHLYGDIHYLSVVGADSRIANSQTVSDVRLKFLPTMEENQDYENAQDRRKHNPQIRKENSLRSPRVEVPSETNENDTTSVVPLAHHTKRKGKMDAAQFFNLYHLSNSRHRNTSENHSSLCKRHSPNHTHPQKEPIQQTVGTLGDTKGVHKGHTSSATTNSQVINGIRQPRGVQHRRQTPTPPLRKGTVTNGFPNLVKVPSNTPVLSRSSSQDWLDRSFDCSCD